MNPASCHERGFTLLEVLVAFSIFAVSMGLLFQIFSQGTRAAMLSDEYNRAIVIAQSRLAGIGIEDRLDVDEYHGRENDLYRWTVTIEPHAATGFLEAKYGISQRAVEIVVSWDHGGKTHSVKLNTVKLIPAT